MTKLRRRTFLAGAGLGAASIVTAVGTRFAVATPNNPVRGDVLLTIFLRGGADGLTMCAPYGYSSYRRLRPRIAVPPPGGENGALSLDKSNPNVQFPSGMEGMFGMHPGFKAMYDEIWARGNLAIVPATGMPLSESPSRSHFSQQYYCARGSGSAQVRGGFMGRMINIGGPGGDVSGIMTSANDLLEGGTRTVGIPELSRFGVSGFRDDGSAKEALRKINRGTDSVSQSAAYALDIIDDVEKLDADLRPGYPNSQFGRALSQAATMINSNLGVYAISMSTSGWDHHSDHGTVNDTGSRFWRNAQELSEGLAAFSQDTNQLNEISVAVVTEFGRTINENGALGTDHGWGATNFFMGGGINGGVYGDDYPDVIQDAPRNGDLEVLTDYRKPLSEVIRKRVGVSGVNTVFPTYTGTGDLGLA